MFYKIIVDSDNNQSGVYGKPLYNNLSLPSSILNDKKRFVKVYAECVMVNCEVSVADKSHILVMLNNLKPLNQIEATTGGFTNSGMLCIAEFFKTGNSNDNTYKYKHWDNSSYLVFDKNQFASNNVLEFEILDPAHLTVSQPSSTGFRDYHIILAVETTDEI
jgi:hypothetical protein